MTAITKPEIAHTKNPGLSPRPLKAPDWFGMACWAALLGCSVWLWIRLLHLHILTGGMIAVIGVVLLLVNGGHSYIQIPFRNGARSKVICGAIALVISAAMIYAVSATASVQSMLVNISGKVSQSETSYVFVLQEDPARDIGDATGYRFGVLAHTDGENTAAVLGAVEKGLSDISQQPYPNALELVQALYDKKVDAIILNEGYLAILERQEAYADFSKRTRSIYQFTQETEMQEILPNTAITREPFVVYCSGSDARSTDINAYGLSDVNIIAVINPTTHQILLINTPRDYYVPLVSEPYIGKHDKLTHVGGLGIRECMKTLGSFYEVDVPYFVRINFTGLIEIVDSLGGIDVVSPFEFDSLGIGVLDNGDETDYHFKKGPNHLNGHEALAFCRERYAFGDGDNQRGKNQMEAIRAIVEKASSSAVLTKYDALLQSIGGSVKTNMPYEDIASLLRLQISTGADWNVTSYAAEGTNASGTCAISGYSGLFIIRPEETSVEKARELIQTVLSGGVPSLAE